MQMVLPPDRIDVWRVGLDSPELSESGGRGLLTADEVARAARFYFEEDRRHFVNCRTALRILLGRYLEAPPGEIRFHYGKHGRPEIALPEDSRGLRFNVADSGGLALMAVGSGRAIGVDVEKVRPMPDLLEIARGFFSAREIEALVAVSEDQRQEAFFACWTRKEAFLKATGMGLMYPLSAFSVSVDPDGPAELLEFGEDGNTAAQWSMKDIKAGEGFKGALAWTGGARVEFWEW
jgi:4'-phosphopantetheinyl transferase